MRRCTCRHSCLRAGAVPLTEDEIQALRRLIEARDFETGAGAGVSSLAGAGVLAAGADDEDEEDDDEELDEIVWPEARSS